MWSGVCFFKVLPRRRLVFASGKALADSGVAAAWLTYIGKEPFMWLRDARVGVLGMEEGGRWRVTIFV